MSSISVSRRGFVQATAVGSLGLWTVGIKAFGAEMVPFRVGLSAAANTVLAIWMADDAGFYKAQGLDISLQKMAGGGQSGPELKSGHIQAMHIGLSSIVRANGAGADLRVVGSLSNVVRFSLFTKPEVRTAAELRGGVVGISTFGSESDVTLAIALKKLGLTRGDVTVKEIGVDPKRIAALQSGEIRATMLNEPSRSHAISMGFNPIVDLLADHIPWVFTGIAVDHAYLRSHREVLIRFLKATIEGNYLALSNAARSKALLAKQLNIADPKVVEISYKDFVDQSPPDLAVSRAGARNIIAAVAKPGASHKLGDYIDNSLIAEIRHSGFLRQMQRKYRRA
ncbi:MAG TPA: ABC transporter substrate-binding protein [Stellaceae bacterium]|nr:ABC transporter substrate-binding protein [Stellaceae bacterium]